MGQVLDSAVSVSKARVPNIPAFYRRLDLHPMMRSIEDVYQVMILTPQGGYAGRNYFFVIQNDHSISSHWNFIKCIVSYFHVKSSEYPSFMYSGIFRANS